MAEVRTGPHLYASMQILLKASEWCITELQETSMADPWYEVLSVLHLMAMVCFVQANTLLLPRSYADGHGPRVSEGWYRSA